MTANNYGNMTQLQGFYTGKFKSTVAHHIASSLSFAVNITMVHNWQYYYIFVGEL